MLCSGRAVRAGGWWVPRDWSGGTSRPSPVGLGWFGRHYAPLGTRKRGIIIAGNGKQKLPLKSVKVCISSLVLRCGAVRVLVVAGGCLCVLWSGLRTSVRAQSEEK